jgi:DNA transformation protein
VGTRRETVDYVLEQLEPLSVRARAMFGEYGLYCDEKIVALICDDTVFLKPTTASDGLGEAPAYPGAKPSRVVPDAVVDDAEAFRSLVAGTAALLAPKPGRG